MRAGDLNQRIQIDAPDVQDATGAVSEWVPIGSCWANIRPRGSAGGPDRSGVPNDLDYLVSVRWREDVAANMRVTDADGNQFRVNATYSPFGRERIELVMACTKVYPV